MGEGSKEPLYAGESRCNKRDARESLGEGGTLETKSIL